MKTIPKIKTFAVTSGLSTQPEGLNSNIMACGLNDCRVHVFDYNGNTQQSFGGEGRGVKQFNTPWGLVADSSGRIIVCDQANNRVVSISEDSWEVLLDQKKLGFISPLHIAIDRKKKVLAIANRQGSLGLYSF